eukprot:scaffold88703_cov59-Phaeocystis_antarctica.AAC.4
MLVAVDHHNTRTREQLSRPPSPVAHVGTDVQCGIRLKAERGEHLQAAPSRVGAARAASILLNQPLDGTKDGAIGVAHHDRLMPGPLRQASCRDVAARIPRAVAVARTVGCDAASWAGRAPSEARSQAGGFPGARAL